MSISPRSPEEVASIPDPVERLVAIMELLRSPEGCPWDRKQTLESLKSYLIEESYETLDAIDSGSPEALRGELGDVLLQVVFQSQLAREMGWFTFQDVAATISEKLVRRHPHIFSTEVAETPEAVLQKWEQIKSTEKDRTGLLSGIPRGLPALQKAHRIGQKTSRVGFDWPDVQGALDKVVEELKELAEAEDDESRSDEMGDLLLAMTNVARHLGIDPEMALQKANDRFISRFNVVETQAQASGRVLSELSLDEMESLWQEAKRLE